MVNARKKVIVRQLNSGLLRGYLPPAGIVRHDGEQPSLDLLDLAGRAQTVPLENVKLISFVREFYVADDANPERLPRRTFVARPRSEGLWVRLTLQGDDVLEGLAPLDLQLADHLVQDLGLYLTPPDIRGNTQRLYVPRSAITMLQILAVISTPTKRRTLETTAPRPERDAQLPLALARATP